MSNAPLRVAIGMHRDGINDWESAVRYAREAERLGVFSFWSAEAWGHDGITPLAYLAGQTESIKLGTGIIQGGTRSPALVGMTAMSLQSMSGGRFMLGLGTSGPQVVEGWHGVPFAGAVSRLKETAEIVRMVCSGERVVYEGQHYTLPLPGGEGRALRSGAPPVAAPPIYLASLGPRSLRICGAVADGWLGTSFIPETADVFLDDIRAGAESAGRSLDDIDLEAAAGIEFTDDPEEAGKRHARGIAFTLGAMGSAKTNFYNDAFCRQGWDDAAKEVQRLWVSGERDLARERVPVELAFKVNMIGTDADVLDRLRVYRDAGINTIRAGMSGETVNERIANLERFMHLVNEINAEA
jgi:F420-dependent oxidoreductase-like protein